MPEKQEISADNFEKLLDWLNADRDKAGREYETIRLRLIKILAARGCHLAEEMADETIDRVAKKAHTLSEFYRGEPLLYFYAVAKKVFLEYVKTPRPKELSSAAIAQVEYSNGKRGGAISNGASQTEDEETKADAYHRCLSECMEKFAPEKRRFIIDYYGGEKQSKIDLRKTLRRDLGISSDALRVRAHRIRESLRKCVSDCVKKTGRL